MDGVGEEVDQGLQVAEELGCMGRPVGIGEEFHAGGMEFAEVAQAQQMGLRVVAVLAFGLLVLI